MPYDPDEFGAVLPEWKAESLKPWARLRYELARYNISQHVNSPKLRVLDFGGGNGIDTIYYAEQGHDVTLIDCSPIMLSEARKRANKLDISDRITIIESAGGLDNVPIDDKQFDLILCHMMIEFVPDAISLTQRLCNLLSSGGSLSILETNRYSDVYLKSMQMNDLSEARKAIGAKRYFHSWVNRDVSRFSAEFFIERLNTGSYTLAGHYGVLSLCAYLPNEPKFEIEYYNELLDIEKRLTGEYPYYLLARFFQLVFTKRRLAEFGAPTLLPPD